MAKLSGGTQLDPLAPTTSSAIATLIKPLVAARTLNTYRMRYVAPTGGSTTHTVSVTLNGRTTPVGSASYAAPATPATPWSFAGLYVRISMGNYDTGLRHLAGVNLTGDTPIQALDDAAAAAETRAAICGLTTIAFEPGGVTAAAILDDLISSAQSVQPVVSVPKTATPQNIIDAANKHGVRRVPAVFASLLLPASAETAPASVRTMRVAILQERGNASGGVDIRMDLPPTMNTVEPLGSDPVAAFAAGLARSTEAAAAEATNFQASAFSSLTGRPLTLIPAEDSGALRTYVNAQPAAQQDAWEAVLIPIYESQRLLALVPTDGKTAAFWVVDSLTGAATAVLLDGSGGALTDDANCTFADDWLSTFLNYANAILVLVAIGCLINAPPTNAGIYYCLGKTADTVFQIVNVIFASLGVSTATTTLGLGAALTSLALAFVPFGSELGVAASEGAISAAGGEQTAKMLLTLGVGIAGLAYCESSDPPAQPEPPNGGTSVEPPPVCAPDGAEDGVCR
jgi:hypothetical protein